MAKTTCDCAKAKRRRHKIIFQRANAGVDAIGGQVNPWTNPITVTTVKAAIEPLRGFEMFKAQQVQSTVTHRITMKYRRGISPDLRIRWMDRGIERIFNILSALDIEERHEMLEIMAVEGRPT